MHLKLYCNVEDGICQFAACKNTGCVYAWSLDVKCDFEHAVFTQLNSSTESDVCNV